MADTEVGMYVYCVVNNSEEVSLGNIGVENNPVYMISEKEIGAVVHECKPEPYQTTDGDKAKEWVLHHQYVIDVASDRFGTVVPLTFDTIMKGDGNAVKKWLRDDYQHLKGLLERFAGKDEYGVKVYVGWKYFEERVNSQPDVQELVKAIDGKSKGAVYLYQKKLERTRKTHIESEAKTLGGRILKDIEAYCDGLKNSEINLYKFDDEEKCLILNASCLVKKEDIGALGAALSRINAGDIKVVFTGPWSPYSFVSEG